MTPIAIAAALSLFFLLALVASSPNPHIGDCVPKSCGDVTNITYPFWVTGQQPDYCGFPEFELKCINDTSSLQTPNGAYQVRSISYTDQSIHVAPSLPDVGSASTDCPIYSNLTFTSTPFKVSLTNWELLRIYNCTKLSLLPNYYPISCGGNDSFSLLNSNYSFRDNLALPAPCNVVVLPVSGFPGAKPSDYATLISGGFLLHWTETACSDCKGNGTDCSDCQGSGGDCGFDPTKKAFMCICEDGILDRSCGVSRTNLRKWGQTHVAILVPVSLAVIIMCSLVLLTWIRCKHGWMNLSVEKTTLQFGIDRVINLRESEQAFVSPLYPLYSIIQATNNFSNVNKLGEGGFGPVYKGKFIDGQEIAVKRLATKSGQGREEFENEIILIAKLQHRNLVRLLGYCIDGEEKILIYEYMPNKSLDYFLYDTTRRAQLDWSRRLHIIEGISQGLLYLHKHSRLRIIHRDLKASNILLDADMNPKISDFGLARIFGTKETEANTNRIVGTYGYMSPEYAAEGIFSIKSDVFSFGVLLLEIVSGSKNNIYHRNGNTLNLLGYAWELWKEAKLLELVDPSFEENCPQHEISRCIHIALMCVQENAIDRPNMSNVVAMLSSDSAIANPKQPAFFNVRNPVEEELHSINGVTITSTNGR